MPIYEAGEKCRMPVLFHTGEYRPHPFDTVAKQPVLRNMAPITMDRIARSFPALHIVMAAIFVMIRRNVLLDLRKIRENQQPCNGIPHHGFLFLCAVTSIGLSGIGFYQSFSVISSVSAVWFWCAESLILLVILLMIILLIRIERGYSEIDKA